VVGPLPNWLFKSRPIRRVLIWHWRVLLRAQRATLGSAVLVVSRRDGRILALPNSSGGRCLPDVQLDAWVPILTQVEELLGQLTRGCSTPSLVAVDGTPGREGVTFVYSATVESALAGSGDELWLEPDIAASMLGSHDSQLLRLGSGGAQ
jgi:hypothetical protein